MTLVFSGSIVRVGRVRGGGGISTLNFISLFFSDMYTCCSCCFLWKFSACGERGGGGGFNSEFHLVIIF